MYGCRAVAPGKACRLFIGIPGALADRGQQRPLADPSFRQDRFFQDGAHLRLGAATAMGGPNTLGAMDLVGNVSHGQHGHSRSLVMLSMLFLFSNDSRGASAHVRLAGQLARNLARSKMMP